MSSRLKSRINSKNEITENAKLKVLFVSSGNIKNFNIAPFIKVQGDSLLEHNVNLEYFRIIGKGFFGYISNIKNLRKVIRNGNFDLVHAHFTLSAWVAVLSNPQIPIVVSFMGSDAYGRVSGKNKPIINFHYFTLLTYLIQPFVKKIISKSPNIDKAVWLKRKSYILPNGVNTQKFFPSKEKFRSDLGLDEGIKYALFLGNTADPRKNFNLLDLTRQELKKNGIEIISPFPVSHEDVYKYLNSVDVLVMCSFEEGSPNIAKEAMACNCKGVFTDVGDIKYLVENTIGYEVADFDPNDLASKIIKVVNSEDCKGRTRLIELGLEISIVAKRLKQIYLEALK